MVDQGIQGQIPPNQTRWIQLHPVTPKNTWNNLHKCNHRFVPTRYKNILPIPTVEGVSGRLCSSCGLVCCCKAYFNGFCCDRKHVYINCGFNGLLMLFEIIIKTFLDSDVDFLNISSQLLQRKNQNNERVSEPSLLLHSQKIAIESH